MRINKTLFAVTIGAAFFSLKVNAQIQNAEVYEFPGRNQQNSRQVINIPDIKGYQTLKNDFHIHTVFSDGQEWLSMRENEAWNDGLDAPLPTTSNTDRTRILSCYVHQLRDWSGQICGDQTVVKN